MRHEREVDDDVDELQLRKVRSSLQSGKNGRRFLNELQLWERQERLHGSTGETARPAQQRHRPPEIKQQLENLCGLVNSLDHGELPLLDERECRRP